MGCFDSSCSLSHIPVHHGDPVVRVFVGTQGKISDFANMRFGGEWTPVCLPIRGEYNDYGDVEEVPENDAGRMFLEGPLMKMFESVTPKTFRSSEGLARFKDEVHCGDQPFPDSWAYFGKNEWTDEESCGKAYKKLKKSNGTAVGACFVHAELWDHLCSLGPIKDCDEQIKAFLAARHELITGHELRPFEKDLVEEIRKESGDEAAQEMINHCKKFAYLHRDKMKTNSLAAAMTLDIHGEYGAPLNYHASKFLLDVIDAWLEGKLKTKMTKEEAESKITIYLRGMCELVNFWHGSRLINQSLEPVCHRAGQYQETKEAIATFDFLKLSTRLQGKKIYNSFYGDELEGYYEQGDPEMDRVREIQKEIEG